MLTSYSSNAQIPRNLVSHAQRADKEEGKGHDCPNLDDGLHYNPTVGFGV